MSDSAATRPPTAGTKTRQVYDILAEYPGVKCSTQEVAAELGWTSHFVGSILYSLWKSRKVQRNGEGKGQGSSLRWWVSE